MDKALIALIMAPRARTKKPAQPSVSSGHFESKVGTPRRSRKGRTYNAPNGYAFYCPSIEEWQRHGLAKGIEG